MSLITTGVTPGESTDKLIVLNLNRIFRHLATTAVRILACPLELVSEENLSAIISNF